MLVQLVLGDSKIMGAIRTIAIVVLSISFVVFVALFGRLPAFRKTPIGWLYRAICVHGPNGLVSLDRRLTGGRITSNLSRFFDYIMNEPHPLVMIFFILLQSIGEVLFIPPALPFLVSKIHYVVMPTLIALPYLSLYYCYITSSTVTAAKHSSNLSTYPYDYILYHPNIDCRTCHLSKPARSKHCAICNVCVQKQDHHCIWINNCVGRNNVVWFMALLVSISALLLYASFLGHSILDSVLQARYVPPELVRGSFTAKRWSTKLDWYQHMNAWGIAIALNPRIGATTMLCVMCFPLSTAFCIYHVYLMWAGMTTNESAKWNDLKEDIHYGLVWKAKLDAMRVDNPQEMDVKSNPGLRFWPVRPEWWVIRTRGGRQPSRQVWAGREGEREPDHRWHRVRSMRYDIDNVYDIGFWENVKDMFRNRG